MTTLAHDGITVSYNGVSFGTQSQVTEIQSRPIPDSAGRTVTHVLHTVSVRATIAGDPASATDTDKTAVTLTDLRRRLTAYGGALIVSGIGFGDLRVNVDEGGVRDALWGPRPQLLRFQNQGAGNAASVEWTVQVAIPECDTATYERAIMEYCWGLSVSRDADGYSTRVYQGHICIPQTRGAQGERTLRDSVDRLNGYYEKIVPEPLEGFRRTGSTSQVSESKCRLDFTITDMEMSVNIPPPGITQVSLSHSASTSSLYSTFWTGTFTGKYQVARDVARGLPLQYFQQVVKARLDQTKKVLVLNPLTGTRSQAVIFKGMSISEPDVYGRDCFQASLSYTFLSTIDDFLRTSALWTPVPGSDWQLWRTSLANTLFHPRGNAKLALEAGEDVILDLCAQPTATLRAGQLPGGDTATLKTIALGEVPSPAASWLGYQCQLFTNPIDHTVELKTLPERTTTLSGGGADFGSARSTRDATLTAGSFGDILSGIGNEAVLATFDLATGALETSASAPGSVPASDNAVLSTYLPNQGVGKSIIQKRASASWEIVVEGHAFRAGYTIAPPALQSVGEQPAIPANERGDGFGQALVASWFGLPIYGARWRLRYILPDVPAGDTPTPPTPFLGY